jgi:hypothetical protein
VDGVDVEAEFMRIGSSQDKDSLDADLYRYWLAGGWWGSHDESGEYRPDADDDCDTTSVISDSTASGDEDILQMEHDEQTSTQMSLKRDSERMLPADTILDTVSLARLLHPETAEEQEEAQTLSAHLQYDTVMTRSVFRRREQLRRSRVLLPPGMAVNNSMKSRRERLSPQDEEQALEQILLSRRNQVNRLPQDPRATHQTESMVGEEEASMPCVVCQTSVRTIIVWPCRCLSLCDDCRVSLAMNNFDKCVCCRRDVMSFSRIFVP